MNKKIFGIKVGTYLLALACAVLALVVWLLVKVGVGSMAEDAASAFLIG